MRVAGTREIGLLERNLEFLANVGSISPYVGLFGTVWGIMGAFQGLGDMKDVTIAVVAPHISEALIATAMGLFAAIPAQWAYNRYANQGRAHRLAATTCSRRSSPPCCSGRSRPTTRLSGAAAMRTSSAPQALQAQVRNQRRAVHRRDAGAADHLHGHHADDQVQRRRAICRRPMPSRCSEKKDPVIVSVTSGRPAVPDPGAEAKKELIDEDSAEAKVGAFVQGNPEVSVLVGR